MDTPKEDGGAADHGRHSTTEELLAADARITEALKGPMSNLERGLLVADRKDIRALLRARKDSPHG